jgi:hypothetical protein
MKRSQNYIQSILSTYVEILTGEVQTEVPPTETFLDFCPSPCAGLPIFENRPPSFLRSLRQQRVLNVKQVLEKKAPKTKTDKPVKPRKPSKRKTSDLDLATFKASISHLPKIAQDALLRQMK